MESITTIRVVQGDITEAKEEYIAQQNNCLGVKPKGLSATIAKQFPYANPYSFRKSIGKRNMAVSEDRPLPGSITILEGPNEVSKKVICMFAQYGMGRPYKYNNSGPDAVPDSYALREHWFWNCLEQISKIQPQKRKDIAMPYNIGCGLAGGDWKHYLTMLELWVRKDPMISLTLYKLDIV